VTYNVVGAACGISRFRIGGSYRVYGSAMVGDRLSTGACNGIRTTRLEVAAAPPLDAPTVAAPPPPRARSGCAGCAAGGLGRLARGRGARAAGGVRTRARRGAR